MSTTAAGLSATTVTTDQQAPLGFELIVPTADAGEQVWIYVQANGNLTAGMVCSRGAGTAALTYDVIPAPTTTGVNGVVGVCVTPIADNSFGFIMKKGICAVVAGTGTIDVNEVIVVDSTDAGTAMRYTNGAATSVESGFGWASANAAATATAQCYINCVG
tara:strand:+ start:7663 stop:8145 length:483 start_codon:yes stop_codon:yes gene_type:complete